MIGVFCLGLAAATALIVAMIPAMPVHGLSCAPISLMEAIEGADAIFEGKVLSTDDNGSGSFGFVSETDFKVVSVWKGDVPPIVPVRGFYTPAYQVEHTYVVFASEWTEADNNALLTHGIPPGPLGFRTSGCMYPFGYGNPIYDKGIVDESGGQIVPRIALATLIAMFSIAGVVRWRMRRRQQDAVMPPDLSG